MTDEENVKNQEGLTDIISGLYSVTAPVPEHWSNEMISHLAVNVDTSINLLYQVVNKLADLHKSHNKLVEHCNSQTDEIESLRDRVERLEQLVVAKERAERQQSTHKL